MTGSDTAPDIPGVVVGWRTWQVRGPDPLRLLSPLKVSTEWPAGAALDARCELRGHPAPDPECTCGLYAARVPAEVGGIGFGQVTLLGCVALWGVVVEGERGWRAGHGRPVVLFCGPALPAETRAALAHRHGAPVHPLPRPVAQTVERPGIDDAAERVRTAAAGAPPDPRRLDVAARAFVAAAGEPDRPEPPARRGRRRVAVGTALLAGVAASALLLPPAQDAPPLAPEEPASAVP